MCPARAQRYGSDTGLESVAVPTTHNSTGALCQGFTKPSPAVDYPAQVPLPASAAIFKVNKEMNVKALLLIFVAFLSLSSSAVEFSPIGELSQAQAEVVAQQWKEALTQDKDLDNAANYVSSYKDKYVRAENDSIREIVRQQIKRHFTNWRKPQRIEINYLGALGKKNLTEICEVHFPQTQGCAARLSSPNEFESLLDQEIFEFLKSLQRLAQSTRILAYTGSHTNSFGAQDFIVLVDVVHSEVLYLGSGWAE